jgi:hypothetical protein
MNVKRQIFLIALLGCLAAVSTLYAGTTGKISGMITDATTGEPLISANVIIKGSSMGASSNIDGNYLIMNVPPGDYTLVFSIIGYQQVQIQSVHVSIDLNTTIDLKMQPAPIEVEPTIIISERPLVTKDNTGSLSTVGAAQIKNMPVQTISDILRLDAGIVEARGSLHIRGGRASEVSYWVDGIATTDVYDGSNGVRVENAAVQELQVISGTFNAEYGQAMSGIVNTVTKEGGESYSGQIKIYGGDYISSDSRFSMYKKLTLAKSPTGGTMIVSSERVYPLEDFNPIYDAELNLSGPVPLIKNLRFFALGRYYYDEGYYYGVNWYRPNGVPGDGSIVAMNPSKSISLQGKLSYNLTNLIKLSYGAFWNQTQRDRNYFNGAINSEDYKYDPYGLPQNHTEGLTQTLTLNHVLSSKTFYDLRINRYYSETKQYKYENPYQSNNYLYQVIDTLGNYGYVVDPNGPEGYIDPTGIPLLGFDFYSKGMDPNHFYRSTSYWAGKFDITSQVNKTNELKFGAEARFHELTLHTYQITSGSTGATATGYFVPAIPSESDLNRSDYVRNPKEISFYLQDKMEYEDIILNIGLRYDYFDPNSVVPTDPNDPNIYGHGPDQGPVKPIHKYRDLNGDGIIDPTEAVTSNEYTPDERRVFMHKEVGPKKSLSPRLGFSFPITETGILHFSYGHFSQIPQFQYLYADPDFKVTTSASAGSVLMGNADLEPQRTVMYEIGLQQQFSDVIGIDVTLFYRDVRGWVGTSPLIPLMSSATASTRSYYYKYENKDYENVKGITLKIEKRFSDNFSFRADYTLQSAEGTYSDAGDAYNALQNGQAPVLALLPLNFDQRHTINVQLVYGISDWIFSLIGRYWSGLPYTPTLTQSAPVGGSLASGLATNSARLPEQKIIDLTVSKSFRLSSKLNVQLFMNVYNLLDQRDITNVYTDTGSPEYTTTTSSARAYNSTRVSTVDDGVILPSWYTAPRQVQVGLALGFN